MTLARALMKDAEFVMLDDTLSAVDAKTEQNILSMLRSDLKKTTALIVSHRLASVSFADQILVLNDGRFEAIGTHQEQIAQAGTYADLYKIKREVSVT
jgi:ATP-binding cassette subfamily B protein